MSIEDSLVTWVIQNLPHDREDNNVASALKKMRAGELLVLFFNWFQRLPSRQARRVLKSVEFIESLAAKEKNSALAKITTDIEAGNRLTKYLSRRVQIGFELPEKLEKNDLIG